MRARRCALGGVDAGALQIFGALLDVGAQLFVHVIGSAGAMEQLRGNGTKVRGELHRCPPKLIRRLVLLS
jgi:hypothetical protein